jgi:hypothetical protein
MTATMTPKPPLSYQDLLDIFNKTKKPYQVVAYVGENSSPFHVFTISPKTDAARCNLAILGFPQNRSLIDLLGKSDAEIEAHPSRTDWPEFAIQARLMWKPESTVDHPKGNAFR